MSKHILVIDDESEIRDILREAFTAAGHRVTAVASANEGLQVVRTDPPDLVLTDLQLEETDGFELIDAMHALRPDIPVILLTGVLFDPEEITKAVGGKLAAYIDKTAPLKHIMSEVDRLLAARGGGKGT